MKHIFTAIALLTLILTACSGGTPEPSNAAKVESTIVNNQQDQYNKTQPVPFFDHSLPRQLYIDFYKAKNNAVATYTYLFSEYSGKTFLLCDSVGYPFPGGTQLTNGVTTTDVSSNDGDYHTYQGGALATIQQPEPDGLFPPSNASGTIVMCLNPDGTVAPLHVEPNVVTIPYELANADTTTFARRPDGKSTIALSTAPHS